MKQEVEVAALRDQHIIGAAQPVSLDAPQLGGVFRLSGGVVRVYGGLRRGQKYTVYSYAPRPEPSDLARVGADYPAGLERFFDIGRTRIEPFGVSGRDARVQALFDDERYVAIWPYEDSGTRPSGFVRARERPYGAVVAIETWLRSTGGFTYDESPPASGGLPPLAHFVAEGKSGYCQHFAGAMALMLRFLGIPARVAGGFTSGKREGDSWIVTDHNAHAWVEVWFPGYGWLAVRSDAGARVAHRELQRLVDGVQRRRRSRRVRPADRRAVGGARASSSVCSRKSGWRSGRAPAAAAADDGRPAALWLLLLAAFAVVGAIGAAKAVRRRLRYLTHDPRRLAGAARRELAEFLADQGACRSAERNARRAAAARA